MNGDVVAWIVLVVSVFYLLDRLMIWLIGRGLARRRRRTDPDRPASGSSARPPHSR